MIVIVSSSEVTAANNEDTFSHEMVEVDGKLFVNRWLKWNDVVPLKRSLATFR